MTLDGSAGISALVFHSLAFDTCDRVDYADAIVLPFAPGSSVDPAEWAAEIFSVRSAPRWVAAALALRRAIVPLVGIKQVPPGVFTVSRVEGEEALIVVDDDHLDFRCAVGVDVEHGLVRVTTAVTLHGRRGRFYFAPVRLAHPIIVTAMLRRAIARMARGIAG